jgi:endonuclease YncB( thermonuclease family)
MAFARRISPLLAILLLASASCPACAARPEEMPARVVSVTDGDTVKVEVGEAGERRILKVRLLNIDSPEEGQSHYVQARLFASELVNGKTISLRLTGGRTYDRVVGTVRLPDGRDLGQEMVRGGYAWAGYSPSTRREKGARGLLTLEEEARRARRGLWTATDPLPPWEFRQRRREASRR